MNIKLLVATHKKYEMPKDDIYLPIHVGKEDKVGIGFIGDNTGENISLKNENYCELTAVYWAWKNLHADYIGLVHYRRHFYIKKKISKFDSIMTSSEAELLCKNYDIIVPKKRRYYIESNYSHYIHIHEKEGLNLLFNIIQNKYPEYRQAYDLVMNSTSAHMFNMFIMKKEYFDKYCEWLFDILFEIEKKLDITNYSIYEARVFGFLSELMLDIWLITNEIKYKETKVMYMEKQNWIVKGASFLKRKFVRN